jgi:CheY-like chemotaxis protein
MEIARSHRPGPGPGPSQPPRTARPGARALLVEDERVVGDLLADFLTLEGYEVDRAMNGREALELVRRRAYALIVSDVRMPDVDGPALYHELRLASPELTRRMVFVTGDVMSPETRRFLDETCLRYLEKPFTIGEFQAVVRSLRGETPIPEPSPPGLAER